MSSWRAVFLLFECGLLEYFLLPIDWRVYAYARDLNILSTASCFTSCKAWISRWVILPPFQIVSRFSESKYINSTIYLNIMYISVRSKIKIYIYLVLPKRSIIWNGGSIYFTQNWAAWLTTLQMVICWGIVADQCRPTNMYLPLFHLGWQRYNICRPSRKCNSFTRPL
jgi:hypothetical protein